LAAIRYATVELPSAGAYHLAAPEPYLVIVISNYSSLVVNAVIVICMPALLLTLVMCNVIPIGSKSNLRNGTTGKTAGKQRSVGAYQQRLKHVPGKETIIFSTVHLCNICNFLGAFQSSSIVSPTCIPIHLEIFITRQHRDEL